MTLAAFLHAKGEAYSRIDTARMARFWAEQGSLFAGLPKVIHLVGTNGKGSTGRLLALFLQQRGIAAGHYSSPHLLKLNERFWLQGGDATDEALEQAHQELLGALPPPWSEALSYFEYATLLAAWLFQRAGCEAIVWEAGLGGEFDATAVFPAQLLLVTPIDSDHQAFLGNDIAAIAATKLRAMRCPVILAAQTHAEVYAVAESIAAERGFTLMRAETLAPDLKAFALPGSPPYMAVNRQLAFAAARFLGLNPGVEAFAQNPLLGRLTKIAPNVWVDVGHNPAAAEALRQAFLPKQVTLVYNSYQDKDYAKILKVLEPVVKEVQILAVEGARVASRPALIAAIEAAGLPWRDFQGVDAKEHYLVFGSFSVVETFLKAGYAR